MKSFRKFNRWAGLLGGIMAAFWCSIANAQLNYANSLVGATLIYSNAFNGGAVNISNTPPNYAVTSFGGSNNAVWVDALGASDTNAFYANGTVGTPQGDAILLPFVPQSNCVYIITATMTFSGAPSSWIGAGFANYDKIIGGTDDRLTSGGIDWALVTESSENVQAYNSGSSVQFANQNGVFSNPLNTPHTLKIILDTTFNENPSNKWVGTCFMDTNHVGGSAFNGTYTYAANPTIAGVGFTQNALGNGSENDFVWNSFELYVNHLLIVQQPASASVSQGAAFTNSLIVGGTPPFYYQWYTNGVAIGGATNANLVLNPVTASEAGTNYTVVVTNVYGAVTSTPASLTIFTAPIFASTDPITYTNVMELFAGTNIAGTNYLGSSPHFSVFATGQQPLTYQWQTNGVSVGGATNTTYSFSNCQWGSPTNFICIASNALGTATNTWSVQYIPTPVAPYPQGVLALGPLGYWRMDEMNYDSGQLNDGEICNDFMSGNNGLYTNTALGFSPGYTAAVATDPNELTAFFGPPGPTSGGGAFSIGTNDDFSGTSNAEFSVSVWANGGYDDYNTGNEPQNGGLVAKGGDANEEFALDDGASSSELRFMVRNAAGALSSAASTFQLGGNNNWYHIVGVCDESNGLVTLYINGVQQGQATIAKNSGVLPDTTIPIIIGSDGSGQFYGALDDVAIFNHALSAGQVAQLYEDGGGTIPTSIVSPLPPTNAVFQAYGPNSTLTVPAIAFGSPPIGYYWTNVTAGGVISSGSTNVLQDLNATLVISNAPASLSGDELELVVTNGTSSTNWFTTLFTPPPPVTLSYSSPILYSNLFDGGTWSMNGMQMTAANSLVGGTNTTWIDALGTNDTGSLEASGLANSTMGDSWLLPFTPETGYIYTINAGLTFYGYPGNWVGIGFVQSIPTNAVGSARMDDGNVSGVDWLIAVENTANVEYFGGPIGALPVYNANGTFSPITGPHTMEVVLNTTAAQWTITAYVDGTDLGTTNYTSNPSISGAGITQNVLSAPNNVQWNYWSLTEVAPGGVPPYLLAPLPPSSIVLTNSTVAVSATAYGSAPLGYTWSFNNSAATNILASGGTNNLSPISANLSVPTSSVGSGQLELTVTNAYGTNITFVTLVSPISTNPVPIVPIPEPTSGTVLLTWPADHIGWQLQAQTNTVGVGLTKNWYNYNPSTGTNQVAVSINLTNGTVFYRLTYTP